jgi:eukaryotic-like serine/threonine-protein kinase
MRSEQDRDRSLGGDESPWEHGPYRTERMLGRGGAGEVYLARDRRWGTYVAIKRSRRDRPRQAEVVWREGTLLSTCRYRHVPVVHDVCRCEDGSVYFAADWVDGPSLNDLIARHGRLAPANALSIARAIGGALSDVHASDMLHRDVKPENVLLPMAETSPNWEQAKLIDFSIATRIAAPDGIRAAHTAFGNVAGTADYMAPEQLAGRRQTVATDIYGLGMVLFAMLFGRLPHAVQAIQRTVRLGPNLPRVFIGPAVARRLTSEVDLPDNPCLGAELKALVASMLRLDPGERPCSIQAVVAKMAHVG